MTASPRLEPRAWPAAGVGPPTALRSPTVIGPTLALVDAGATTGFVMGEAAIAWAASDAGFGSLGITAGGLLRWTPLVDALLIAPRAA